MKTAMTLACGFVLLLPAGCARNDALPSDVTQAFEQAFNRDDIDATAALFAKDAQILADHGPVVSGPEGIKQFLRDQMTPVISFNTETDMSIVRGDIGVEQGHYRVRDVRRGSDVEEGKYVHVWRREGRDWKLYRMIYNTDVAPDAEVSVAQSAEGD
jgi:ketosteroid isomerase-like protein